MLFYFRENIFIYHIFSLTNYQYLSLSYNNVIMAYVKKKARDKSLVKKLKKLKKLETRNRK